MSKEISHKELYDEHDHYKVVAMWVECGNLSKIARETGIHYNTLRNWKKNEWWGEKEKEMRSAFRRPVLKKCEKLLMKTLDAIDDRLENGDEVAGNSKDGPWVQKVKVAARDLTRIVTDLSNRMDRLEDSEDGLTKEQAGGIKDESLERLAEQLFRYVDAKPDEAKIIVQEPSESSSETVKDEATKQFEELLENAVSEKE